MFGGDGAKAYPEEQDVEPEVRIGGREEIDPHSGVKRGLKNRHLSESTLRQLVFVIVPQRVATSPIGTKTYADIPSSPGMLALAGIIGPGLLVGSGRALQNGGPASLIIGFGVIGIIAFSIMQSLGELTTIYPAGGSFVSLADRLVDRAFSVAVGWNYFIIWAAVLANEYNVISSIFVFWSDRVPIWGYFLIFWAAFLGFQLLGVEAFGEVEFWLALLKLMGLAAYFIFAIVYASGGLIGQQEALGFRYWNNPGAFNDNGFRGVAAVFVFCSTFYAGVESVAVAATETRNPGVAVPQAIRQVFWRIIFVYMGSAFFFGLSCPANATQLVEGGSRSLQSPMTAAIQIAGWEGGVNLVRS